ncbi:hypothetical protein AKJ56_01555 [candidate division MSBL1 archaeon SCGC-AAA382N08]|uniref:Fido domain-containing protein n=1 Tax=candidate division MSBL1 archaeon SCGC-AAA382N08 TaxID=1698285 RepID=A0A133VPE6_9EURY|nr:hypothetical protein AKJ56_01555 [candidate division MSBL1 archaeon SCGC-AAA382N08]
MKKVILKELRSRLLERASLSNLPKSVWKRNAALNTWGTNAVEGNTITRKEAEKILIDKQSVANKPTRDVMETIQHEQAFRSLLDRQGREITLETILELHEEVFRGILKDAGQWRRVNVRIKGAKFSPPRMEKVVQEMENWKEEYRQKDVEGGEVFNLGAWMHYEFERIHPFSDGNGRVGRLVLNLHFLNRNWPPIHVLPRHKDDYLDSLNEAANENFDPLKNFLKTRMTSSLIDLLDQVGTKEDELITLKEASKKTPYGNRYLSLRCKQGELPALKSDGKWKTSETALKLYMETVGRK